MTSKQDEPPPRGGGRKRVRKALEGATQAFTPPGDPVFDLPFGFEMKADGLMWKPAPDKEAIKVCGPFEVVAETRPEMGDEWGLLLRWKDRDGRQHEWIMPRRLLAGEAIEVRAHLAACGLDVSATQAARQALVRFLSVVRSSARVRTVPRTGWYLPSAGGAAFVLPRETIGTITGEVVRLDLEPAPRIYSARGSLDDWRDQVARLCVGNSRLLFAVSAAFAAPLLPIVGDEGGGMNFRGESSKGKTTLLDVVASVWGAPSKTGPDAYVRQWRTTASGVEGTAMAHNHAPLVIDEMGQADPKEVPETLYMLANGRGKVRAERGGGNRRDATWLTLVLSSSEESAARMAEQAGRRFKAGQEVRMLDVPAIVAGGFGCFDDLHGASGGAEFAQQLRRAVVANHGTAAPAFLRYLADRLAREIDFAAASVIPLVQRWCRDFVPRGADGQVHRAARRMALVAIAGELATEAGITGWTAGDAARAAGVIFRDWLQERGGTGAREDHHLLAAFRRFMGAHGSARFEVVREATQEDDALQSGEPALHEGLKTIQRVGWRWQELNPSGERIWVYGMLPEIFDAEIAAQQGMEGREARERLGKARVIREGIEAGKTRWTYKAKRIPGHGRPRLLVTDSDLLNEEAA